MKIWVRLVSGNCSRDLGKHSLRNTVLLSRMIPPLLMLVINLLRGGGSNKCQCMQFAVIFCHSYSYWVCHLLLHCCGELFQYTGRTTSICFCQIFGWLDNFFREWGDDFDYLDLFCFFRRFVCCKRISEFCLRSIQHFMIDW